ncbi:MAG: single-stranded DNA-binding protein [Elusimicrobiota bacterium]
MITGRLTRDPEFMVTQNGIAKCWFSVAVNRRYRDKASGEWKDDTAFVPVAVWRDAAQRCKEKLKKGSPVHVEGRLRSRKFEDKASGAQRTVVEVEARRVQFLAASEGRPDAPEGEVAHAAASGEAAAGDADIEEVPF